MSLITKYRPTTLDEVIGHSSVVKSLKKIIKDNTSHAFLFSGSPGIGKTSLARIVASDLGCDIREVDAASNSGIDEVRELTENMHFKAFGGTGNRAYILDEVHALSKSAFQALLKSVEEPPSHVYWLLCTTEPTKVPASVKTRCNHFGLNPLSVGDISKVLDKASKGEGYALSDEFRSLIVENSEGSPRKALSLLGTLMPAETLAEARKLIHRDEESPQAIELCRALANNTNWQDIMEITKSLENQDAEGIRHMVLSYFTKVALNAKNEGAARKALAVIEAFSTPQYNMKGQTALVYYLGSLMLS